MPDVVICPQYAVRTPSPRSWFASSVMKRVCGFGYIAKIFDNVVELKIQLNETTVPKMPIEIDTGKPIGPPVLLTNNQAIRRQFEKGTVQILKPFSKSISYEFSKIVVDTLGHPGQPIAKERNPKKE
jgi:hypothetical protein